jgi:hypothetical protein
MQEPAGVPRAEQLGLMPQGDLPRHHPDERVAVVLDDEVDLKSELDQGVEYWPSRLHEGPAT